MTQPGEDDRPLGQLVAVAASGQLRLDDTTAQACVLASEQLIDSLDVIRSFAAGTSTRAAYGTLGSAQQLGAKFESKATGAQGLRDVLQQHIDTVVQLRDLFERAGRAYREADETAARLIVETG